MQCHTDHMNDAPASSVQRAESPDRGIGFYRALVKNAPGGTVLLSNINDQWRMTYADEGAERLFGYAAEDLCKLAPDELTHPADVERVIGLLLEVISNPSRKNTAEYRFRHKDGTWRWIESVFSNMLAEPEVRAIVINFRDIERQKKAEIELRESETRFRNLADQAPVLIWMSGTDKLCYHFNKVWLDFTGRSMAQEQGNGWAEGVHPDDFDRCLQIYVNAFDRREEFRMEYRLKRYDGVYRWILDNGHPTYNAAGAFTGYIGSCIDITDFKDAQQKLEASEQRLRLILNSEPECVKIISREGNIVDMNPAGQRMLECASLEEVQSRPVMEYIAEPHREAYMKLHRRIMDGETGMMEYQVIGRKGGRRWLETHAVPLRDANGTVQFHLAVTRDITDRRNLADQLLQSQKLSSMGTLASGIAHDFNNILAIIFGYLPMLEKNRLDPAAFTRTLDSVQTAADRASRLVQQLLTFAHKTEFTPEPVNVKSLISEIAAMLSETFPPNISIAPHLETELPSALFDAGQFHQMMMNVCINARDAMPEGGVLTISVSTVAAASVARRFPDPLPCDYIQIIVEDTGAGMSEETRRHMFDPFFTTKAPGRGTGLGLSVVYSILQHHHGFIEVESQPGAGTRILIYVPTTANAPAARKEQRDEFMEGDRRTVLIIEDEPMLLETTSEMLQAAGFEVLTATEGFTGLSLCEKHPELYAVVTDLGLPGIGGEEVVRRLRAMRPEIKIVVSSGFIDPKANTVLTAAGAEILLKPYRMDALVGALRSSNGR